MPLENHYSGDEAFLKYSQCFQEEWGKFEDKIALLELVNGDVALARPIAYHLRHAYKAWFSSSVPALGDLSPTECLKSPRGIKRLKECLLRFP